MMFGKTKESGVWIAPNFRFNHTNQHRIFVFRNDTIIYCAFFRLRLRIMKPTLTLWISNA